MTIQELVEGSRERPSNTSLDDFRDWGKRWGQDDDRAQLTLQCQWDNLLRHLMGITAAMEVWDPMTDTEQGDVTIAVETSTGAPDTGNPEVGGPPTSDNASASTLTYNWGPTSEMCLVDMTAPPRLSEKR